MKRHGYRTEIEWTGNTGTGTANYRDYRRDHVVQAGAKAPIPASSDPAFRGDPMRYNPEELLVASLSSCHMLWYLHLCAVNGVVVTAYRDAAEGEMTESPDGAGEFTRVVLRPAVTISAGDPARARALHEEAHRFCFIARSVKFPVECEPEIVSDSGCRGAAV
jgi:organic hydroperoxide reductase OsmC/OhrA